MEKEEVEDYDEEAEQEYGDEDEGEDGQEEEEEDEVNFQFCLKKIGNCLEEEI